MDFNLIKFNMTQYFDSMAYWFEIPSVFFQPYHMDWKSLYAKRCTVTSSCRYNNGSFINKLDEGFFSLF